MSKRTRSRTTAQAKRLRKRSRARCLRRWGGAWGKFILIKKRAVPASLMQWALWFTWRRHQVKRTRVTMSASVSTVFLGLDYSFDSGTALLFEDAVIYDDGRFIDVRGRHATYNEAILGHRALCKDVEQEEGGR